MLWYINYPESETKFTSMHNVDFSYPAHLHGCMEMSFCVRGAVEVTLSGVKHTVSAGQGIVIPPHAVHSYQTGGESEYYTFLFSRSLLPDFSGMFSQHVPARYVFSVDGALLRHLLDFYASERTLLGGKSLLYRAAEAFVRDNPFTPGGSGDDELTVQIVTFIQDNFCENLSLQDIADRFNYSYFHISKRIRQVFGVPFSELLAQYRVAAAKSMLDGGKCSISEAAFSSGFGSIRTFNRIFRSLTGETPSQYLARSARSEVCRLQSGG